MRRIPDSVKMLRRKLVRAERSRQPCRLRLKQYGEGVSIDCFTVKVGAKIVVFEVIGSSGQLEGFNCVSIDDIERLDCPGPHAEFRLRLLSVRKQKPTKSFPHDLSTWKSLIESAEPHFPLTTIHVDDVCYVGKVISIDERHVSFQHISPAALWDDHFTNHALGDIGRVDFGCPYEEGLFLVGGSPPDLKRRSGARQVGKDSAGSPKSLTVSSGKGRKA